MPDLRYKTCRGCSRPSSDVGELSWQRLCRDCGRDRYTENMDQMNDRRGPNWDKWRRSMVLCAYPELFDLLPPSA